MYNSSYKVFRDEGRTVEVKFSDVSLQASAYDTRLDEMKAWVLLALCVDKGEADVKKKPAVVTPFVSFLGLIFFSVN